ncbi:MAG TPA: MFS transporter [Tepidisphaeraceae bacterium]|jgi:OPA family sugar phosphate sensor protein UhpC-like MFS transporter
MTTLAEEDVASHRRWRWQIFAVTWLAYAGFYLTRKSFSVAKIGIQKDPTLGWSDAQLAWIDGAYLTAYAIGQFLFGMLGDRLGTRIVVGTGMLLSVIAAAAMGASSTVILFGICFIIQGLCQSSGWGPLAKNISAFFSRRERGTIMGLWCTNYALGGLIASLIAGYAGKYRGWRWAFFFPAMLLFCVWIAFMLFQRNAPEDVGMPPVEDEATPSRSDNISSDQESTWRVIGQVITNPMVILLSLVYLMVKPARYAILFWGPKYMHAKLGSDMLESGGLSALFELAGPISALGAGFISDRLFRTRRVPVCVIGLLLLGVLLFCFNFLPTNRWMLGGSFFMIGLLLYGPDSLITGTAAVDFGTRRGASTASGVINGVGSVGAILGGTLPGFFNARWGWGGVFALLGAMVFVGGLMLVPKWNALPQKR